MPAFENFTYRSNVTHSNATHHNVNDNQRPRTKTFLSLCRASAVAVVCTLAVGMVPMTAFAVPTVVVNNPNPNTAQNAASNTAANNQNTNGAVNANAAVDPQVAPPPASPFNNTTDQQNPNGNPNAIGAPTGNALDNPNSLASNMHPSDQSLSDANQQLLSRNAQLQRDVNDLETRVNVLINERSGQLFMYGAVTVVLSLFAGFVLAWFIFSRRERW